MTIDYWHLLTMTAIVFPDSRSTTVVCFLRKTTGNWTDWCLSMICWLRRKGSVDLDHPPPEHATVDLDDHAPIPLYSARKVLLATSEPFWKPSVPYAKSLRGLTQVRVSLTPNMLWQGSYWKCKGKFLDRLILQLQLSQLLYSYYMLLSQSGLLLTKTRSQSPTVTTWRHQGAFFIESCRDFLKVALVGFLVALVKDVEWGGGKWLVPSHWSNIIWHLSFLSWRFAETSPSPSCRSAQCQKVQVGSAKWKIDKTSINNV